MWRRESELEGVFQRSSIWQWITWYKHVTKRRGRERPLALLPLITQWKGFLRVVFELYPFGNGREWQQYVVAIMACWWRTPSESNVNTWEWTTGLWTKVGGFEYRPIDQESNYGRPGSGIEKGNAWRGDPFCGKRSHPPSAPHTSLPLSVTVIAGYRNVTVTRAKLVAIPPSQFPITPDSWEVQTE